MILNILGGTYKHLICSGLQLFDMLFKPIYKLELLH